MKLNWQSFLLANLSRKYEFIGVLTMPDGHRIYTLGEPDVEAVTGHEEGAIPGISYNRWEPDGSAEYVQAKSRLKQAGSFISE